MADYEDVGNELAMSGETAVAMRGRLASTGIHDLIEGFLANEAEAGTSQFDVESALLETVALHIAGLRALDGGDANADFDVLGARLAMHLKSLSQSIGPKLNCG